MTATATKPTGRPATAKKARKAAKPKACPFPPPPPVEDRPAVADFAAGLKHEDEALRTAALAVVAQCVQTAWDVIRNDEYMQRAFGYFDTARQRVKSRDMAAAEDVKVLLRMAWETLHKAGFQGAGFDTRTDGQALRDAATVADRLETVVHFIGADDPAADLYPHLAADRKAKRTAARDAKKPRLVGGLETVEAGC